MFRFWGKPWRRRRGGPVPAVRVWMEMAWVEGEERRVMVWEVRVGNREVYVSVILGEGVVG